MARTPLLRFLRALAREHHLSERSGSPLGELRQEQALQRAARLSRRGFVTGGTAALAGAVLSCGKASPPGRNLLLPVTGQQPRIAIVGAGLAGLTAAVNLVDQGFQPTLYEFDPVRAGGRMMTWRGPTPGLDSACGICHVAPRNAGQLAFAEGQYADIMGELIDSSHRTMLGLIRRFGLSTVDLLGDQPPGSTDTYFFQGRYYPMAEVDADYARVRPVLTRDLRAAGYPTTYEQNTPEGRVLSSMTLHDWIESRVPGGHGSLFGMLLDVAYTIEYGAPTTEQSALNLVYLLGYSGPQFSIFGESDERYAIAGGADLLPRAMADTLGVGERIQLGWRLEALAQESDGTYTLDFGKDRGSQRTVRADMVLLAIPFAVLRTLDYSRAGFDALKVRAIEELGAARNGKQHLQFTRRLWREPGPWGVSTGSTYADTGYQSTWEATRGQPGTHGILVNYTGGPVTEALHLNHPYGDSANDNDLQRDAQEFLQRIEPVYPGLGALWNGKACGTRADLSPRFNSSYSYWKPGQPHTFGGYERVRQGNVFFAGEHTSVDFQGWMEGAASEGERVATEMVQALRRGARAQLPPREATR